MKFKEETKIKFETVLKDIISTITSSNVPLTVKADFFGYFVHILSRRYVQTTDGHKKVFNNHTMPSSQKAEIVDLALKCGTLIGGGDAFSSAEDFRYVLDQVLTGVMGESPSYGFKAALLGGILQSVHLLTISSTDQGDPRDTILATRRYTIALGVLHDVVNSVK